MTTTHARLAAVLLGGFLAFSSSSLAAVGWRTDWTGTYPDAKPPLDWTEEHVLWKAKMPGNSYGSPIVLGDRVFVVSDPAELLCVNAADGKVLWQRSHNLEDLFDSETAEKVTAEFMRLKKEKDRLRHEQGKLKKEDKEGKAALEKEIKAVEKEFHDLAGKYPTPPRLADRGSTNSAATPASDRKNIYALFGNGIACAYTKGGEKLWVKYIEPSELGFGHSSSPVLIDGKVLVHFKDLVALDAATGEEVWRVPLSARHATSVPARVGETAVVVHPAGAVVRVSDGKVLLKNGSLGSSECTPVLKDDILYVYGDQARALRLVPADDDGVKLEKLWETRISRGRRTPSAVLHDGLLYAVNTDGFLDVLDAETGESLYQRRLNIGGIYASATAAGDYVFFGSTRGEALAVKPGKEFEQAARNRVEGFGSSPVFHGTRLFLRTQKHLYCIGE